MQFAKNYCREIIKEAIKEYMQDWKILVDTHQNPSKFHILFQLILYIIYWKK